MSAFSRNLASAGMHPAQDVDYCYPMPGPESLRVNDPVLLGRRAMTIEYRESALQQEPGVTPWFEPAQELYLTALTEALARPRSHNADAPSFAESVVLLLVGEREARLREIDMIYAEQTAGAGLQRLGEDAWHSGPIHQLSRRVVVMPSARAIAESDHSALNQLVAEAINHAPLRMLRPATQGDIARSILDVLLVPMLHEELELLRSSINATRAARTSNFGSTVTQLLRKITD